MLARIWFRLAIGAWAILSKGSVSEVSEIMKNEDRCGRRGLGSSKSNSGALPDSRPLIWTKTQIAASLPHFAKDLPDMACGHPGPPSSPTVRDFIQISSSFRCHLFSIYSPFICGTALIAGYSEKVPRHMQWKWREARSD